MNFKRKKIKDNNKLPAKNGNGKKNNGGRPTKYMDIYPTMAEEIIAEWGINDEKLARTMKVKVDTITKWKKRYPEFLLGIKKGKKRFSQMAVEGSFLRKATGFHYEETEVIESPRGTTTRTSRKYHPPDTGACIYHLKVWDPDNWKEKKTEEIFPPQGNTTINVNVLGKLSIQDVKSIRDIVGKAVERVPSDSSGGIRQISGRE